MVNEVSSADVQAEYINRRHNINSTSTSRRSSGAATTQVLRSARTQKGPKNTNNAIFRAKKTMDSSRNPQIAPKSLMIFKSTYELVDFQTDVTRTVDTWMNGCSSLLTIACGFFVVIFCLCRLLVLSDLHNFSLITTLVSSDFSLQKDVFQFVIAHRIIREVTCCKLRVYSHSKFLMDPTPIQCVGSFWR